MSERAGDLHRRARIVATTGALTGLALTLSGPGLVFRPNRIAAGEPQALAAAFGGWGAVLAALWAGCALLSLTGLPQRARGVLVTCGAGLAMTLALWQAGVAASAHAASVGSVARTSLGWAFWLLLFAGYVTIYAATAWLSPGPVRALLTYLPVIGAAALALSGSLSDLAVARELAVNAEGFAEQLRLHLAYVAASVGAGLLAGLALGWAAAKHPVAEPVVFGTLNVLQVIPTLAFVGLMNPVLTALSDRISALASLGVRGVGWTPVVIVLSTYAVYPIARNTHAAIVSLDPAVIDAATGVGMGAWRRFLEVELPLALPVVIAGLRVALVQTTAGAIIAGLVGGGGLGTFVFLGASETASDLILLGVLPIVALTFFFDRSVRGVEFMLARWGGAA